jgi:hypothetical protein
MACKLICLLGTKLNTKGVSMVAKKSSIVLLLLILVSYGCAGVPVREATKVDMSLPVGEIAGSQFTGIRYPFKVSAPPGWQMATKYPDFMVTLGYDKEGLEESELFIFNPVTQSNVQIDFTPASRYTSFSQGLMEGLVSAAGTDSFVEEIEEAYGKEAQPVMAPTEAIRLKGVQYAARKYATYTLKGAKREQGWVYAFSEPYQIFILYMLLDTGGTKDQDALKAIIGSFEYIPKK